MKQNILVMGPLSPPFNGQSIAFTGLVTFLKQNSAVNLVTVINTSPRFELRFYKFLNTFFLSFKIIWTLFYGRYNVAYFTCSRTFLGSFKDLVFINFCSL